MKRLYLVGASKDGKKLVFAQKKGAKFGSLEVPMSPKLLKLVGEQIEARDAKRKPAASEPVEAVPPPSAAEVELASPHRAESPVEPPEPDEPDVPDSAPIALVPSDQIDIPIQAGGARRPKQPVDQPLPGIGGPPANHPSVGLQEPEAELSEATVANIERIRPRTEKPEIPAKSKLSPAEIQTMIRAGRGIRSVANLAGTPIDWVRYLAEPIQEERRGIVRQMLTRKQERARLGPSSVTIGEALFENLRKRGIRSPEVVIDEGFTAFRPDGREWRVRLVFEHRGRKQTASWSFDAQTRQVVPLNSLATSLGWRKLGGQDEEGGTSAPRARRSPPRGRKRTTARRKSTTRKKTSVRTKRRRSR